MNIVGAALDELYRIFEILNKEYYEGKLPEPVITIQKTRPNNLGHFTLWKAWKSSEEQSNDDMSKYEININPLNLNRSVTNIVVTLHHEMVHYLNKICDIKDCNGQIHNKKFKESAERLGLICEKSKQYGWGFTEADDSFKTFIDEVIKPNEKVFTYFRDAGVPAQKKQTEKKIFKYVCPQCGMDVKAKRDLQIKCGDCDVLLVMEEV